MRYIKSIIVGMTVAVFVSVMWVLAVLLLPIAIPAAIAKFSGTGGAAVASVSSGSILAAALLGFTLGFVWHFRKHRATR